MPAPNAPTGIDTAVQVSMGSVREATFYTQSTRQLRPSQRPANTLDTDIHELPLRDGALSMNRLMWRSVLNMADNLPGTESSRSLSRPRLQSGKGRSKHGAPSTSFRGHVPRSARPKTALAEMRNSYKLFFRKAYCAISCWLLRT